MKRFWVVQGHYGHGWEDLTADYDRENAKGYLDDYRANENGWFRVVGRWERATKTEVESAGEHSAQVHPPYVSTNGDQAFKDWSQS